MKQHKIERYCKICGASLVGTHGNARYCRQCWSKHLLDMDRESRQRLRDSAVGKCRLTVETILGRRLPTNDWHEILSRHAEREYLAGQLSPWELVVMFKL